MSPERKAQWLARGLCPRDSRTLATGRKSCQRCLDRALQIATKRYRKLRHRLIAEGKARYYSDLEKSRAYGREQSARWRAENPEAHRAVLVRYAKNNPEKHRAHAKHAKASRRRDGETFTSAEWVALKKFHDHRCLACGKNERTLRRRGLTLAADHVVPLARGGSNLISNIQPLCQGRRGCNNRKGAKYIDYRKAA